jgi:hypothetical protein
MQLLKGRRPTQHIPCIGNRDYLFKKCSVYSYTPYITEADLNPAEMSYIPTSLSALYPTTCKYTLK